MMEWKGTRGGSHGLTVSRDTLEPVISTICNAKHMQFSSQEDGQCLYSGAWRFLSVCPAMCTSFVSSGGRQYGNSIIT